MRVAGGRGVPQSVVDGGRHRAEVALRGEHLPEGVGDVHHVDVGGVDHGLGQGPVDDFAGQIGEVIALAGEIAGEIALIPAENPDIRHSFEVTTTKRAAECHTCYCGGLRTVRGGPVTS